MSRDDGHPLQALIQHEFDKGEHDFDTITKNVLRAVSKRDDGPRLMYQTVLVVVSACYRLHVRDLERTRFRRLTPVPPAIESPNALSPKPVPTEREQWLLTTSYVPGKGRLPHGEMTTADHKVRAEWLRGQLHSHVSTVEKTIAIHEDAATRIEAAGVTCLNDLEQAA